MVKALYFVHFFFPLGAFGASKENPPIIFNLPINLFPVIILPAWWTGMHLWIREENALDYPKEARFTRVGPLFGAV